MMLQMSGGEPENGLPVWRLNQILLILRIRMESIMNDPDRKSVVPFSWSVLHMHTTTQLAKLLAIKRGCDVELAAMIAAFHDVYSFHTGKWEDHGKKAGPYVKEIITEYNDVWGEHLGVITKAEVKKIIKAIRGHSEKEKVVKDKYAELLKDIDCLDSYLHGFEPKDSALERVSKVFSELGFSKEENKLVL
ncbi:MAG: HD domain-containing protein [Candidatus Thorarchaeota archaeon]